MPVRKYILLTAQHCVANILPSSQLITCQMRRSYYLLERKAHQIAWASSSFTVIIILCHIPVFCLFVVVVVFKRIELMRGG